MSIATNSTEESAMLGEWVPVEDGRVTIRQRYRSTSDVIPADTTVKTVFSIDHGTMLWILALVVGITIGAVVILATRKCDCGR